MKGFVEDTQNTSNAAIKVPERIFFLSTQNLLMVSLFISWKVTAHRRL
jgi:hypothetical protein